MELLHCLWRRIQSYSMRQGRIKRKSNLYVIDIPDHVLIRGRAVTDINWDSNYAAMQIKAGYPEPGYLTHESGAWSDVHKCWFFLPRKASKEGYDPKKDESCATNLLMKCSEDFSRIDITKIGVIHPTRGYASFKFLPGSGDQVIVAIKSEEVDDSFQTFITAFNIDGQVLMPDVAVTDKYKFEGLEFL